MDSGTPRIWQKLANFDDKYDKRLERHAALRERHTAFFRQENPSWGKGQNRHLLREEEFLKRRRFWIQLEEKIRPPPESNKCILHVPINKQTSCHHNGSESYNDVTQKERGVQTIQETAASCLKKESSQQTDCTTVLTGELLQLSEYLTEALHKEQNLNKKLCVLQEHLSGLEQTSEKSWMLSETWTSERQRLHNQIQGLEENPRELQALGEHLQEEKLRSLQGRLRNSEEQKLELLNQIMAFQTHVEKLEERGKSDTATILSWEREYAGLQSKVDLITAEHQQCKKELKLCKEKLKGMTRRKPKKLCCFLIPVLMISSAVMAFLLPSYIG